MDSPFARAVREELARARARFPVPINSHHEAFGVIKEELDEYWREVMKRQQLRSRDVLLKELVQVAAMCQAAAEDLGLVDRPGPSLAAVLGADSPGLPAVVGKEGGAL